MKKKQDSLLLEIQQLQHRRGKKIIFENISFHLRQREILVLMGKNGAGKTTLLEMILGIQQADAGSIQRYFPVQRSAYLPDKAPLYPSFSVQFFLEFCAQLHGVAKAEDIARVVEICQLQEVWQQRCEQLSHGYRQRVGLAQALLQRPICLILDEVSNGLDGTQKKALRPLLRQIREESSIIMSSHDDEEAAQLADRVVYLAGGKAHLLNLPPRPPHYLWLRLRSDIDKNLFSDEDFIHDGDYLGLPEALRERFLEQHHAAVEALFPDYPAAALRAKIETQCE